MDIVKTKRDAPSQIIIFCFGETSTKHDATYDIKTSGTAINKHGKAKIRGLSLSKLSKGVVWKDKKIHRTFR